MRAVLTRVLAAQVRVEGEVVGEIREGICAFIGVGRDDSAEDACALARKLIRCRLFEDDRGKMNLSLADTGGQLLAISQFTLYGDLRRGTRPSFSQAMAPAEAKQLFDQLCEEVRQGGIPVQTGRFGADMKVTSINDGPVTLLVDSKRLF